MANTKRNPNYGGARSRSGRPPKIDKELWGKITCVLKHGTIAQLRDGAKSRFFGEFLQHHLDRFPLPSRDQYLYLQQGGELDTFKRRRYPRLKPSPEPEQDRALTWEERFRLSLDAAFSTPEELAKAQREKERDEREKLRALEQFALEHNLTSEQAEEVFAQRAKRAAELRAQRAREEAKEARDQSRKTHTRKSLAAKKR